MKLETVVIEGFRGFATRTAIPIGRLTAFIGKNDVGKSTVLEALDAFFNDVVDPQDLNTQSAAKKFSIGCIFSSLPENINLDATSDTTLSSEYLLNADGKLEIYKTWKATASKAELERVYVVASAPSAGIVRDLLFKKRDDLRELADELAVQANRNRNPDMRSAIYGHFAQQGQLALELREVDMDLPKEKAESLDEARKIWKKLSDRHLPIYALFKSEQVGGDKEAAIRAPLALTLKTAIKSLEVQLSPIAEQIEAAVRDTTERTLERLRRDYPEVARNLAPEYKAPSWASAFSLDVLRGDDEVPLNKRGAGVRRLVVLAFFQAEAEKKKADRTAGADIMPVIYAIEEPETSQHPDFQKNIIRAFESLADAGDQVIITTHVPGVAGLIPTDAIRLVTSTPAGMPQIEVGNDEVYEKIVEALGVLPDRRARVALYVEGPNDVEFLLRVSRLHRSADASLVDLDSDPRIAFVPMGGGNLQHWVNKRYLANAQFVEVHIYDTDDQAAPQYGPVAATINARGTQDVAYLTTKREMENYIHADAIQATIGCAVVVTDWCDLPRLVAEQVHTASGSPVLWVNLSPDKQDEKASRAKRKLNSEVLGSMNLLQLRQMDAANEIHGWLCAVRDRCQV
jgi:putative ATP-dependent endonuclease of OLD family